MHCRRLAILLWAALCCSIGMAQELAPEFQGRSIYDDSSLRLSDYRGKVVFIDFWASWCPPCLVSLPAYDQMYRELGNEEFEFIAINVDEDPEDGLFFLQDHPVSYPVLSDPEGDIGIPYRVRSLPMSYLLDREGRVLETYRNFRLGDEAAIKQRILELLQD